MIQSLDVYLWNNKVGTLIAYKDHYDEKACFYFDRDFIKRGYDIAPIRASIRGALVQNGLPVYAESDKYFGGLPSFIADSLPDHWGNVVFNEWAKSRNIKMRDLSALDRLAYIGRRGMGALEFLPPAAENMEMPFKVEISDLYKLSQSSFNDASNFNVSVNADLMIESLFKVGTSAGGRRPKAIINLNPKTGQCYSGQVVAPDPSYISMIIKFDEHQDIPTTRIEYSYYLMAKDAGMNMMPSRIITGDSATHFLTERFDRRDGKKIHVQTLAAMNPLATSYEDLFDVAIALGLIPLELSQLFLCMTMNVVACNVDDHNKNFSFIMGEDGVWHAAPAYDFTFSLDPSGPGYINRHNMTICGKNSHINRSDLLEFACRYNVKSANVIIERAINAVKNYSLYATEAGVSEHWSNLICKEISDCLVNFG